MKIKRVDYEGISIDFVYSPLFEMFCSLHVLFKPEHHSMRHQWALTAKELLDTTLYAKLNFYNEISDGYMGAMGFCHLGDEYNDFNIVNSLNRIESLDIYDFAYLLLNESIEMIDLKKIILLKKVHIFDLSQSKIEFLLNVYEYKIDFISSLKEYFYIVFQKIQIDIEPYLIRTLQSHKTLSENMAFLDYISILHPRIETSVDKISLHKYKRFDFLLDKIKRIEISISTFIDPHLLMGENDGFLSLTIRCKIEKIQDEVHEDLLMVMKALSDKTRMKIVKCLYEKPTSTQELSARLDISEAGVSKHLKLLFKAKIINKIRQGNYILYFLDKLAIDRIPMDVYQYLDE